MISWVAASAAVKGMCGMVASQGDGKSREAVEKGMRGMACAVPRDDPGLWSFVPEDYRPFCAM